MAYQICGDKFLADDLVGDMYIALKDTTKEINDWYVIGTMRHIFYRSQRDNKTYELTQEFCNPEPFELDDLQEKTLNALTWYERGVIEMNQDESLREMGKKLNTCHVFLHRTIKNAKEKCLKIIEEQEIL